MVFYKIYFRRIGGLEIIGNFSISLAQVIRRRGGLESRLKAATAGYKVIRRIGGLEKRGGCEESDFQKALLLNGNLC